jgi:orotate phosphoribosyltransferase
VAPSVRLVVRAVSARTRLLDLLARWSYRHDPTAPFQLSSGKRSPYYVDCKVTTMRGEAVDLVGAAFLDHVPPEAEAVGGLTMGADPIAHAVASYGTRHGRPLNAFSVRKEAKRHGLGKWVEGCAARGTAVVVVDDVVTTGGSTIDAIRKCREEGLRVVAVVALVDREEESGRENIVQAAGPGVPVTAVFTLREIRAHASGESSTRTGQAAG